MINRHKNNKKTTIFTTHSRKSCSFTLNKLAVSRLVIQFFKENHVNLHCKEKQKTDIKFIHQSIKVYTHEVIFLYYFFYPQLFLKNLAGK